MLVYDAVVKTANAEFCLGNPQYANDKNCVTFVNHPDPARPAPLAMIHTGDSADTGLQSEFDTFITYTNKLLVPWYQAIGNHDVLAFRATFDYLHSLEKETACRG